LSKTKLYKIASDNELEVIKKIKEILRTRCIKEIHANPKFKCHYFTSKYTRLSENKVEEWYVDIQKDFKK
jgi:hypothetical protein